MGYSAAPSASIASVDAGATNPVHEYSPAAVEGDLEREFKAEQSERDRIEEQEASMWMAQRQQSAQQGLPHLAENIAKHSGDTTPRESPASPIDEWHESGRSPWSRDEGLGQFQPKHA